MRATVKGKVIRTPTPHVPTFPEKARVNGVMVHKAVVTGAKELGSSLKLLSCTTFSFLRGLTLGR